MASAKPPAVQGKFRLFVRYTFNTQAAAVSPRDIAAIEHMLRRGRRQLEMYEDPKVRDCFVTTDMLHWAAQNPDNAGRRRAGSSDFGLGRTS
uniref:Transcriptional regulator prz1 n=1 Tax=Ganoderma boninense TaxID=34458 RepID=A0A5K1K477_9APHY|nr:Transcriptional regulator prz1 [Ganoderma boninense]